MRAVDRFVFELCAYTLVVTFFGWWVALFVFLCHWAYNIWRAESERNKGN